MKLVKKLCPGCGIERIVDYRNSGWHRSCLSRHQGTLVIALKDPNVKIRQSIAMSNSKLGNTNASGSRSSEFRQKMSESSSFNNSETRIKIEATCIERYGVRNPMQHPEIARRSILNNMQSPNNFEILFINLFKLINWPMEFTGDGKIRVGNKYPDFINHDKRLIVELFGNHWHHSSEELPLKNYYQQLGWNCGIIWASQLFRNGKLWCINSLIQQLNNPFNDIQGLSNIN